MNKIKQQFLFTALLLLCCTLNTSAEIKSGKCGDNVSFSLDTSTGLLSITGTGEMWDFTSSTNTPWYSNYSSIKNVRISAGVTSIGNQAFNCCYYLTSVTIPNSVTSIGVDAFNNCEALTSVTIPNSVTSIKESAFSGCHGLTSVTIPNSVTSIKGSVFNRCSGLNNITVDAANKYFDSRDNCNAIINSSTNELIVGCKNTSIPNNVTAIGELAFKQCSGLTSVTIPNSVTSIKGSAFQGCQNLTSVTIPNSVTSIGKHAFDECSALTSVNIPNNVMSIETATFQQCTKLASITIPNSVTSIGEFAFSGCLGLTSVTIPNRVTSIGSYAFSGCLVTRLTCESTTPPTCYSYTFDNVDKSIPVYVPEASVAAYKAATVWKKFTNIQAIESTGTSLVPFGKDSADEYVTVYNLSGGIVNTSVKVREIKQLPKGVYIVKGAKIVVE